MAKRLAKIVCVLITLCALVSSVAYAFVYVTGTQTVTQTIIRKWLSGWDNRFKITIDPSDVSSNLTDFPVLLRLSSSSGINGTDTAPIFSEVGSSSKKIAVTTADAKTQCYVEIEKWVYPLSSSKTLRPNASGDATEIASVYPSGLHYLAVDEETQNQDIDYVYTSSNVTSYQTDLYNLPNQSDSGTINEVTVYFYFKTSVFGSTAYGRAAIKTYGTIYNGTAESTTSTFYSMRSYTWATNPSTGSSWTWAEIDALQAGIGLRISGSGYFSRCTQVYVQVSYTPPGGEAWLWTKVPSISSTADTQLYLYYDKDHVDNTDFVGGTGSTPAMNVWDNNFKGVYHLQGDPTPPTSIGWGKTSIGGLSSSGASNSRAMGGMSPNADNMRIKSICIYLGAQTGNVRLAVYSGGQLDNPNSATLLWDAGTVNPNGVAGWYTINHPTGGVAWPANTVTWLAWKLNTGVSVYADSASSGAGDFQTQRGRNENNFNQDPSVAFPSTYGQQGTFANYWYSIYVNYEVSNLKDSSSNSNDGTSSGSMTSGDQVTAKIDGGLDFDGSNDEITCGNGASLQINTTLTIEAWADTSTTGVAMGIVNKQSPTSPYNGYQLRKLTDNRYFFAVGDPGIYNATSNSAYTDSNWHYIVGVKSATNYLFMDGIQQTNTFIRALTDSGSNFDIGRGYYGYNGYWWSGQIDEVRVSNINRSAAWIFASYETGRDHFVTWISP